MKIYPPDPASRIVNSIFVEFILIVKHKFYISRQANFVKKNNNKTNKAVFRFSLLFSPLCLLLFAFL